MNRYVRTLLFVATTLAYPVFGQMDFERDTLESPEGNIEITFLGHGSLTVAFKGKIVYFDPVGRYADFSQMPKADLILVTHEHGDHLDSTAIENLRTGKTSIIHSEAGARKVRGGIVMKNGEVREIDGIKIEAVPAYNLVHMRSAGVPFHAKGSGNGYVVTFGKKRIYVAGDTENVPEMSELGTIDCAFLPMNLPYTMTPEMVAEAAGRIKPKILYPYHFGNTNTAQVVELLKEQKGMEIRLRKMK